MTYQPMRGIKKAIEDRKDDQAKKSFQDEIQYFLSKDIFTLHDFHEKVQEGLKQKSTYKMMIWGDDVEFASMENQNKVISAMTEEEKNSEVRISKEGM